MSRRVGTARGAALVVALLAAFALGLHLAPTSAPVVTPSPEQSAAEWLEEQESDRQAQASLQRLAATIERQRIQICLLPKEYPVSTHGGATAVTTGCS